MRVLLVTGSFPPMACGIGDYTAKLAEVLSRREGVHVAVLTSREGGPAAAGVELLPLVRSWGLAALPRVIGAVRAWRPDVVHVQYPSHAYGRSLFPWLLPSLLRGMGWRSVQTWHEYYPSSLGALRNIPNALLADAVIVVRPEYLGNTPRWHRLLIGSTPVTYVPNASSIPVVALTEERRSEVRSRWGSPGRSMVAFFGFLLPHKGVDLLFDIADPAKDHLVIVGRIREGDPYHDGLLEKARGGLWRNRVTFTGFQPAEEVASILAAADAVVLPFRDGAGEWNTSLHAAVTQGTFVLTTSTYRNGYVEAENAYAARPGDLNEMRRALREGIGRRVPPGSATTAPTWDGVVEAHLAIYRALKAGNVG